MLHNGQDLISATQFLSSLDLFLIQDSRKRASGAGQTVNGFFVTFLRRHRCIWNTLLQLFQVLLLQIISCGDTLILIGLDVQTLGDQLLAMF